jgi:hypothetical protein
VECSTCTALLHDPEAKLPCAGDDSLVKQGRMERAAEFARKMRHVARLEAGELPGVVGRSLSSGLYQITAWCCSAPRSCCFMGCGSRSGTWTCS